MIKVCVDPPCTSYFHASTLAPTSPSTFSKLLPNNHLSFFVCCPVLIIYPLFHSPIFSISPIWTPHTGMAALLRPLPYRFLRGKSINTSVRQFFDGQPCCNPGSHHHLDLLPSSTITRLNSFVQRPVDLVKILLYPNTTSTSSTEFHTYSLRKRYVHFQSSCLHKNTVTKAFYTKQLIWTSRLQSFVVSLHRRRAASSTRGQ